MKALTMTALGGVAAAISLTGCAALNKTRPGDMTIPEHESAARSDAKLSEEAAARARVRAGRTAASERLAANRHRELSNEHAAAAERRRAEVAALCEGTSPRSLAGLRVERVVAITTAQTTKMRGYYPERLKGARLAVATSGDDAPSLARSITCEAARESAGLATEVNPPSPFAVRTASVTAAPASSGLVVEIRSTDADDAAEILRRSEVLAAASAKP